MKILILGSLNSHAGKFAPFITEQAEALRAAGCEVEYFGVVGKGIVGYLKQLPKLRRVIREQHIDIIHAHYGLCCLLANLQRRVPVVSTYHGSDITSPKVMRFSKVAMRLSAWNIFVSKRTQDIAFAQVPKSVQQKSSLIPCGINLPAPWQELQNQPIGQQTLKQWVNTVLEPNKKHVLFAGAFDNPVKDPEPAKAVVQEINRRANANETASEGIKREVQLIELKGYTRDQVNALMYTCDALLMTSKTEGSPQVIKEAMACGLPLICLQDECLDMLVEEGENGYQCESIEQLKDCLLDSLSQPEKLQQMGRKSAMKVQEFDNDLFCERVEQIYLDLIEQNEKDENTKMSIHSVLEKIHDKL